MAFTFDGRNLLPRGVHDGNLEEVAASFAGFQKSDRRIRLYGALRAYLNELQRAACASAVIIDGSFIMACVEEPEDIDLIVVLPPDWDLAADLKPYVYNVLSKRRVKH